MDAFFLSYPTATENVIFDEWLLQQAEQGTGEALRFWENPHCAVVLGRISDAKEDVYLNAAEQDGIEVVRRSSGGGTVVQGPGCLNFSLILSYERDVALRHIHSSYEWIGRRLVSVLAGLGHACCLLGLSDVVLRGPKKKISGQAQHRGRRFLLHHGTLLIDFDLSRMERYLRLPRQQPAYRSNRPHGAFVTNVALDVGLFCRSLAAVFDATWAKTVGEWTDRFDLVRQEWIERWRRQGFLIRPPSMLMDERPMCSNEINAA